MDKLAKRAGVATLVLIASAGAALAFSLLRMASSLDTSALTTGEAATVPVVAAIPIPDVVITTFEGETPQATAAKPTAVEPHPALTQGVQQSRAKSALAPLRVAVAPPPASTEVQERAEPVLPGLDVDLGVAARERGLDDRGSKAFSVRQTGGAEELSKLRMGGERVTFETDLSRPDY